MAYTIDRHNLHEYLGVSGPGDEFTSSGPHGETSLQAQQKASQAPPPEDDDLLASIFGPSDDQLLTAEGGAASDAAQQAINFGNQSEEDIIMAEPLPGGPASNPGVFDPPLAMPNPSVPSTSAAAAIDDGGSGSKLSGTSVLLLVAAVLGVGYAVLGK